MLKKTYSKKRNSCRVTFDLTPQAEAMTASLCGEFNDWKTTANKMKLRKDGRFSTTISLPSGRAYRFRYLLDDSRWENDWGADAYVPNGFGSEDSLVRV